MAKNDDLSESQSVFARNLRKARMRARMTQKEVARAVEITEPVYWKYEAARYWPSVPTFSRLCDALECSADELLEGMEPRFAAGR
jgi:transcriptional regulator with XRE-family HTH domain